MVIKNCNLIDGAGLFEARRDIRIENGKFVCVAENVEPLAGEEVLDAAGAVVTPGFVEANCQVGVNCQIHRFEENDGDDAGPVMPELRAFDALDFSDEGFEMAARAGVTCVVSGPGDENLIGGTCVAVKTAGPGMDARIVSPEAAYRFVFTNAPRKKFGGKNKSPQTRMGTAAMIRSELLKAWEYARKEKAGEKQEVNMGLRALARVFDGMPVQMVAMKAVDIETAARIGEEFSLNYVLVTAYDALIACRDLGRKDFRFVIGPLYGVDFSVEASGRSLDLAARLREQGIHAAVSTGHPEMSVELTQTQLVLLVDRGLDRAEAIRAVTSYPAQYMGIADRVGSIEPGKDADLVIWDGDPIDYYSSVRVMMIGGRRVEIPRD